MKYLTHDMIVDVHQEIQAHFCGTAETSIDFEKLISIVNYAKRVDADEFSMYFPAQVAGRLCAEILDQKPFSQGNSRTALASAAALLALNGQDIELWEPEIPRLLEYNPDEEMFADWFSDSLVGFTPPQPPARLCPIPPRTRHKAHGT